MIRQRRSDLIPGVVLNYAIIVIDREFVDKVETGGCLPKSPHDKGIAFHIAELLALSILIYSTR